MVWEEKNRVTGTKICPKVVQKWSKNNLKKIQKESKNGQKWSKNGINIKYGQEME